MTSYFDISLSLVQQQELLCIYGKKTRNASKQYKLNSTSK